MGIKEIKEKIKEHLKDVKNRIIVLSNKGGVGKTAVSVLLARMLEAEGKSVGLLDADIHGPSTVKALGLDGVKLKGGENNIIYPLEKGKMKLISVASLSEGKDSPLIWRGPMKSNLINQFLSGVKWGKLDYLIIDSPPGTGDEPMSIIQMIDKIDGGIIVTTPQDIALLDSRKCVAFLRELNVRVLGIIENMSGFICPGCGKEIELFKKGGGEKAASEMDVPFLGRLPLDQGVVESMDGGLDFISKYPDSAAAGELRKIARKIIT